jgi:hypothetical protein
MTTPAPPSARVTLRLLLSVLALTAGIAAAVIAISLLRTALA